MVGAHHPRRLTVELQRIGEWVWEIPRRGGMRVPGRIYASEKLMAELRDDPALGQVANVAHLPGIVGHASPCPTSTGATASRSAALPRSTRRRARSRPAASASTSTAACAC